MTDVKPSAKRQLDRLKTFLTQLQHLAWFELFDKWFSLGVKLLWLMLVFTFGIYLRREYKTDRFYVQDFKVPPAWTEQGYSGEVVKQAIIDEIDQVIQSVYANQKSITGLNEDGTELLGDFSLEGFNLKAITKSILAILGKKNKYISGYITINDSTQTVAIQVTDQITQPLVVRRNDPAQQLIHKATLEIMKIKSPGTLIAYYQLKKDTLMVRSVYKYLAKHRELTKDYLFYDLSVLVSLFERQYSRAFAWADSIEKKFPTDKLVPFDRAKIYAMLLYYDKADSLRSQTYKRLFVDNLRKAKEPGRSAELDNNIDKAADLYLAGYYYTEKEYKSYVDLVETATIKSSLDANQHNTLAYAYIYQKQYDKAEAALQQALFLADQVGDYWDSLAELYSLQRKDSLAVASLTTALRCPQKSPLVSVEAYRHDARWQRLQKRLDFQRLLKRS